MYIEPSQLKEFMLDSGLVSRADVESAMEEAKSAGGTDFGAVLVSRAKISEDELRKIQAYVLGIPFVNLKDQKLDFNVLALIPEPIARHHNIIAFKRSGDTLEVAMTDTDDLQAIDFIKKKVNLRILPRLTDGESIRNALMQYQKSLKAEFGDIIEKEAVTIKALAEGKEGMSAGDLMKMAEDLPIVRIVDALLKHAILQSASDIHLEPMENEMLVRYRIDGILRDAMILPRSATNGITARVKVLANLKLDEKRLPQDGRFKVELNNERVSLRVSVMPTYYGEKTVMRLLRESVSTFTLENLGFHGESLERIHEALTHTSGMILNTGPTGSGKTTTLYTLLDILNTPDVNISTIEDPIEYQLKRVNQTQVRPEIGFTFATGLRTLVRQDPDVIMVGEIRDNETAGLAVNAALTGHVVLSTLHTNSASAAFLRLVDMQVEPFLLVSTVKVVIAQRLVRKLCPSKEKYFLKDSELETLSRSVDTDRVLEFLKSEKVIAPDAKWTAIPFWKPVPTAECEDGYRSRIGIYEVFPVTPTIKELVLAAKGSDEIEKRAKIEGLMTMIEDGIFKAAQGITSIEEVLRAVAE